MAKVIEFYVPTIFRKPWKGASRKRRGKVIEFCRQTGKSGHGCVLRTGPGFRQAIASALVSSAAVRT
jgi:hypothetical protein